MTIRTRPLFPRSLFALGIIASAIAALSWWLGQPAIATSWLVAWLFFLGIALGALVNMMIHELTGGAWGFALRWPLEAAVGTLPMLALLGVPLALSLPTLYPWARSGAHDDTHLAAKLGYLNGPFFLLRALVYFGVWIALAAVLRRYWQRRETHADAQPLPALRVVSSAGLLLYAVTMTLAAVDWIMSLSPDWHSTLFGLLVMIGQALAAYCFAVVYAVFNGEPRDESAHLTGDLGNLLLMFVMLWAYLSFVQFLIIWAEDLPTEIGWYVIRSETQWRWLALAIFVAQFALPFAAMLFRSFKRKPRRLAALCAVVLTAHAAEAFWLVAPELRVGHAALEWTDPLAFVAVGAFWLATLAHLAGGGRSVPLRLRPKAAHG